MANEKEKIYIPRFESTPKHYLFGGNCVYNLNSANTVIGTNERTGNQIRNKDLYRDKLWVDFDELNDKKIIAIDDAFVTYKPGDSSVRVWDKLRVTQADWWNLNDGRKCLNYFDSRLILWNAVPKDAQEPKTPVEAKTFEMIQDILQEDEKYTANRFFNVNGIYGDFNSTFKTGVVFKTKPNVFDLLVMNKRYDFQMSFFIYGSIEGFCGGKGLKWLKTYLKDVKENRNNYLKSQYSNQL